MIKSMRVFSIARPRKSDFTARRKSGLQNVDGSAAKEISERTKTWRNNKRINKICNWLNNDYTRAAEKREKQVAIT